MKSRRASETNNALLVATTGILERASLAAMTKCGLRPDKAGDLYRVVWAVMGALPTKQAERMFSIHARGNPQAFAVIVGAIAKLRETKIRTRLREWHRLALHVQRVRKMGLGFAAVGGADGLMPEKMNKAEERAVEELVKRFRKAKRDGFIP